MTLVKCTPLVLNTQAPAICICCHAVTDTLAEAEAIAQRLMDEPGDTHNVLHIQRCNTWIPCTHSEQFVGKGVVLGSKSNEAPEAGRHGNVCDLGRRKAPPGSQPPQPIPYNQSPQDTLVEVVESAHPDTDPDPDAESDAVTETTPESTDSKVARIEAALAESDTKMCQVAAEIREMERQHPHFYEEYLALYQRTLGESGLLRHIDPHDPSTVMYHLLQNHCGSEVAAE